MGKENKEVLKDYIRWRGDLTFEERPFNELDNLVFCEMSYLNMDEAFDLIGEGALFREYYEYIKKQEIYELKTLLGGQQDFIEACAQSKRFGTSRVYQYVDIFDHEVTQFCAMVFTIDKKTSYVAYRGTDNSIIGWKEDFMLSFTRTPAQVMSAEYLQRVLKAPKRYYVGGHSKGANLAVYASANVTKGARKRILRIYMNDGPGFSKDVFEETKIKIVNPMITRIMPSYDVIGQLFYDEDILDSHYVHSLGNGIYQHDLVNWCVNEQGLDYAEGLDSSCEFTNEMFRLWVDGLELEKREIFVDTLFESLKADGVTTVDEVDIKKLKYYIEVIRKFLGGGQVSLEVATKLPLAAIETMKRMLETTVEKATQRLK